MHYPFLVADPRLGTALRLTDSLLAELTLAPKAPPWDPAPMIRAAPDPVWAESLAQAPNETIAALRTALEDLIRACPDLRPPPIDSLPESRAKRHLAALIALWHRLEDALPEGLAAVRHALSLDAGQFLAPLPVIEGSLDPLAPAAFVALANRLTHAFGTAPALDMPRAAPAGSRLHALQAGVAAPNLSVGPPDPSLAFYGLRDLAACADFAAARARALIEAGARPQDIAVLTSADSQPLARAFHAQGVPLSGLPASAPTRDTLGETALHIALAKRAPTPAMVLAALALSPHMPWAGQTGRDLAESVMGGDTRGGLLAATPTHLELWQDLRHAASSLSQLRVQLDRICARLTDGAALRARLNIPQGEGSPDWDAILRAIPQGPATTAEAQRNLEGVSLWSAYETPWRMCDHLIVADFNDGAYPTRPRANPLFLDSEIEMIAAQTGITLGGRSRGLAQGIALFDQQIQATRHSATFLVAWRDLAGGRLQPAAGLSLIARAITPETNAGEDAARLICDLDHLPPEDWPIAHHHLPPLAPPHPLPEAVTFADTDLLSLRRYDDGTARPQSPSRLETLLVSPLAWLLAELGADDMSWSPEDLDIMAKGSIAHDTFEHVFPAADTPPSAEALRELLPPAFEAAIARHAPFLRSPSWELERRGLEREVLAAALRWREHLVALGAKILGNEIFLAGEAHGVPLHGKADAILELPDGGLLVVDHKKSGTNGRKRRMERGWDLQAGLYRAMIDRPHRREGDKMGPLIGRKIAIAYHLMNDGGLLTSGMALADGSPAEDMGAAVNAEALAQLTTRLAQLGAGRVVLNTTEDEAAFQKEAGFTPYALSDGSVLVRAFLRSPEGQA